MFETNLYHVPKRHERAGKLVEKALKKQIVDAEKNNIKKRKHRRAEELKLNALKKHFVRHLRSDDAPITRKTKYLMPECTYEVWHQEPQLNEQILGYLQQQDFTGQEGKLLDIEGTEDDDDENEEDNDDEEDNEEDSDIKEQDNIPKKATNTTRFADLTLELKNAGLEILPHNRFETYGEASQLHRPSQFRVMHIRVLTNLLFINVMRRKWKIAQQCFAAMIRTKRIDFRKIWPLGFEIISKLIEEEYRNKEPEADDYNLRLFFNRERIIDRDDLPNADELYLSLMHSSNPTTTFDPKPSGDYRHLPYRAGTKHLAPLFVQSLIWLLLMKLKFKEANEKLEEVLSRAPFLHNGVYHFLQGYSYQLEATVLSKKRSALDKTRIETLLLDAQKHYDDAKAKNLVFSEDLLHDEMDIVRERITEDLAFGYGEDENASYSSNDDWKSDDEMEIDVDTLNEATRDFDEFNPSDENPDEEVSRVRNEDSDTEDFGMTPFGHRADFDEFEDD